MLRPERNCHHKRFCQHFASAALLSTVDSLVYTVWQMLSDSAVALRLPKGPSAGYPELWKSVIQSIIQLKFYVLGVQQGLS